MKGQLCYTLFAMIDWLALGMNSLWILGAAVWLATLSYHHWLAVERGVRLRDQMQTRPFALAGWLGLLLIAAGLAGTSGTVWETVLWLVLAAVSLYNALNVWRAQSKLTK